MYKTRKSSEKKAEKGTVTSSASLSWTSRPSASPGSFVWKSRLEGIDLKTWSQWSHIRQNWLGTAHHVTFWYSTYASYIKTSFLTILGCECKLQLERAKSLRFDSSIIASLILIKTPWKSHDKQVWFPAPDIILWPSLLCRVLGWTLLNLCLESSSG